ncbi:MAG: hypothetical protein GY820_30440, partial [Gammaproteobacteria bacterium]|nr:hypothetical protein [Gammaproteobacteria bacterium]
MDAAAMQAMITALGDQLTKSLVDQTKKNSEQMDAAPSAQEQRISAAMDEQAKQSAKELDAALSAQAQQFNGALVEVQENMARNGYLGDNWQQEEETQVQLAATPQYSASVQEDDDNGIGESERLSRVDKNHETPVYTEQYRKRSKSRDDNQSQDTRENFPEGRKDSQTEMVFRDNQKQQQAPILKQQPNMPPSSANQQPYLPPPYLQPPAPNLQQPPNMYQLPNMYQPPKMQQQAQGTQLWPGGQAPQY